MFSGLTYHLLQVNDNQPVFTETTYHAIVAENTAVFTKVLQLSATDADSGVNAQIVFSFASSQNEFGVYADSGWIYVRKALDRERRKEYQLKAVATDTGHPSLNATVDIRLVIGEFWSNCC